MVKYTITPWRYHSDLLSVRSQFYSTNPESRRYAVDRVMAWKLRGNLPHAVESTALLIDALLHHTLTSENSIFSIRAVYSAAFTRFVTGFCDIGRNKERSLEPSSMLAIAKALGMPPAFVALRHEATHEELPAIQRLVKATEDALQWLWNVYWSRLEEPESVEVMEAELPQLRAEAREIFRTYRSAARDRLKKKKATLVEDEHVKTAGQACASLMEGSSAKVEAVASVLVDDRLLLPSKRELGDSMYGAYMIWDNFLQVITADRSDFPAALIRSMLRSIASSSDSAEADSEKEGLALWVPRLIDLHDLSEGRPAWDAQRREVMSWVCTHPGRWTHFLGQQLLKPGVLKYADEDFQENWRDILDASQLANEATSDVPMADADADADAGSGVLGDSLGRPSESAVIADARSWVRAVLPMRTPIGMVR